MLQVQTPSPTAPVCVTTGTQSPSWPDPLSAPASVSSTRLPPALALCCSLVPPWPLTAQSIAVLCSPWLCWSCSGVEPADPAEASTLGISSNPSCLPCPLPLPPSSPHYCAPIRHPAPSPLPFRSVPALPCSSICPLRLGPSRPITQNSNSSPTSLPCRPVILEQYRKCWMTFVVNCLRYSAAVRAPS